MSEKKPKVKPKEGSAPKSSIAMEKVIHLEIFLTNLRKTTNKLIGLKSENNNKFQRQNL